MLTDSLMQLYTAGEVRRFHTMRLLHPQNDAEHAWGVALIILWLYDTEFPSAGLLRAALLHDVPECVTGDPPAQVKWANSVLHDAYAALEEDFWATHAVQGFNLTRAEQEILAFADVAELVMFSLIEISMGNVRMRICMERGLTRMRLVQHNVALPRSGVLLHQMEQAWANLKS
jgi:HD containing hydrolase-like enzyme